MRQVADEPDDAAPEIRHAVKVRIAPSRGTVLTPEQVGEDLARGEAAEQVRAQIAVHRRDDVGGAQGGGGADRDGLVAALAERAADAAALLPAGEHALVERAREL